MKTNAHADRFYPVRRTAIDGVLWWVVYDRKRGNYSTYVCHGRYRTKKACQWYIDYYNREWNLI